MTNDELYIEELKKFLKSQKLVSRWWEAVHDPIDSITEEWE